MWAQILDLRERGAEKNSSYGNNTSAATPNTSLPQFNDQSKNKSRSGSKGHIVVRSKSSRNITTTVTMGTNAVGDVELEDLGKDSEEKYNDDFLEMDRAGIRVEVEKTTGSI